MLEVVKYRAPRLFCAACGTRRGSHGSAAWTLLLELLLAERGRIPAIAATLRLSPVQCHVLRLLEPGTPVSMRRVADALACDE